MSSNRAIDCLYLAEDELTPMLEVTGVLRPPGSRVKLRFDPLAMLTVDGTLTDVLDLTDAGNQAQLATSIQELTGHWVLPQTLFLAGHGPEPPTQMLGRAAFAAGGIVALRYPSSKNPPKASVVVFTTRMRASRDSLTLHNNPQGRLQQSLP